MKQVGKIISIDGEYATLLVAKTSMCGENCASCKGGCKPTSQKVVARLNAESASAQVGDMAVLEMDDKKILLGAAAVYLLPLLAMLAAYIIADCLAHDELISIISALAASFFVFFSAKLLDNVLKNNKKYEIYVTKVLR